MNYHISLSETKLVSLLFVLGGIPAALVFESRGFTHFYQNFSPEMVMWACGFGIGHPGELTKPLADFLIGKSLAVDCKQIKPEFALEPIGFFFKTMPYLNWIVAGLWRALGVSYSSLIPLIFLLFGIYIVGVYALSRLFIERGYAFAIACFLSVSPLTLLMASSLRDFSKAPFFIWAIVLLIYAIRSRNLKSHVIYSALAGSVVGIGYGFRADLFALIPVFVLVLTLGFKFWVPFSSPRQLKVGSSVATSGLSEALQASARFFCRLVFRSTLAPAAFLFASLAIASPILVSSNTVSYGGIFVMQGITEPFRVNLGIKPAGYALGWRYSDELTLSSVAAMERPSVADWDVTEPEPRRGVSKALRHANTNLIGWADIFAADLYTQLIKSAGWILGLPTFYQMSGLSSPHWMAQWTAPVYAAVGKGWLPLLSTAGALLLLLRRFRASGREALCLTVLFSFLLTYPAIQFSVRHVFHLEFLWLVSIFSLLSFTFRPIHDLFLLRNFAAITATFSFVGGATYFSAVLWQYQALTREMDALLAQPKTAVELTVSNDEDGSRIYSIRMPERHEKLVAGPPDSMTPAIELIGAQWDVRAAADRLLLTLDGPDCDTDTPRFDLRYNQTSTTWQSLNSQMKLLVAREPGPISALFPAFYRPTQHLAQIVVPKTLSQCSVTVDRINGFSRLPIMMTAWIQNGALLGPSHKGLGSFKPERNEASITRFLPTE